MNQYEFDAQIAQFDAQIAAAEAEAETARRQRKYNQSGRIQKHIWKIRTERDNFAAAYPVHAQARMEHIMQDFMRRTA